MNIHNNKKIPNDISLICIFIRIPKIICALTFCYSGLFTKSSHLWAGVEFYSFGMSFLPSRLRYLFHSPSPCHSLSTPRHLHPVLFTLKVTYLTSLIFTLLLYRFTVWNWTVRVNWIILWIYSNIHGITASISSKIHFYAFAGNFVGVTTTIIYFMELTNEMFR